MGSERTPVRYWLGGDPCVYEGTDDEIVYMLDRVAVGWETYWTNRKATGVLVNRKATGVLVGVKYDAAGFIDEVELAESDRWSDCAWVPNDGIFYKADREASEEAAE